MTTIERPVTQGTDFLWLEITGRCQLECTHCYASSGPAGTHGSMTTADWRRVIDQGFDLGVREVQFIGGEPTLHPDLVDLIQHARARALAVEVFSNLVHVPDRLWPVLELPGVSLATSYYSDDPAEHDAITRRPTHARTLATIAEVKRRGIKLRAGVIDLGDGQRVDQAHAELVDLGVPQIGHDRLRAVGRGGRGEPTCATSLCGRCGDGAARIGPDGQVTPCVFARDTLVGDVRATALAEIMAGMPTARADLVAAGMPDRPVAECDPWNCSPSKGNCYPMNCPPRG